MPRVFNLADNGVNLVWILILYGLWATANIFLRDIRVGGETDIAWLA